MRFFVFLIIISTFIQPLNAHTRNQRETKAFLSQIIDSWKYDSLDFGNGSPTNYFIEDEPAEVGKTFKTEGDRFYKIPFTIADSIELSKQNGNKAKFKIILESLPEVKLISAKKVWEIYKYNYYNDLDAWECIQDSLKVTGPLLGISTPLFYRSYSRAIFTVGTHCGPKCGRLYNFFYIKKHNKWIEWKRTILMKW